MKAAPKNIAIIGSHGAIGSAFVRHIASSNALTTVHAFSRTLESYTDSNVIPHSIDYHQESSIKCAAQVASQSAPLDAVIVATGILHSDSFSPEKSLRDITPEKLQTLFTINTVLPTLLAKHFIPRLAKNTYAIFAALSARVGSISDNRLGGWYSYRASKAALNMVIKNAAIETARKNANAIIVGLHPGTVDSNLSQPFQKNVPEGKLFTPDHAVEKLLLVLSKLTPDSSGQCFAWDGEEVPA